MDVHSPHEPIHSWKDFWIHLGTITIGLLIALALEAGAEKVNHLHQRHQLEADLRAEGQKNREIIENDFVYLDHVANGLLALNHRVLEAEAGGAAAGTEEKVPGVYMNPAVAAWTTATASGTLELLPPEEARVYARLYRISGVAYEAANEGHTVGLEVEALEAKFAEGVGYPPRPVLARMSKAELDQLSTLLLKQLMAVRYEKLRLKYLYGANNAVLRGATSEDDQVRAAYAAKESVRDELVDPGPVVGVKK